MVPESSAQNETCADVLLIFFSARAFTLTLVSGLIKTQTNGNLDMN